MNLRRQPTIGQYLETLHTPHGLFRTLSGFAAERDIYGDIRIRSGNNAAVFKLLPDEPSIPSESLHAQADIPPIALKCYIKGGPHRERIYHYLTTHRSDLLSPARYLPQEIYVYDYDDSGAYHDAAMSDWVEGECLETVIRRAARRNDHETLSRLAERFDATALRILAQEWAHGDLKPENIMIRPDGDLALIDYDAMFIPELEGQQTIEIGTLHYQHPARDPWFFNPHLDDYAIAVISVSLHALALDPTLFARYHNTDNIILVPTEILSGKSPAYDEIISLFTASDQHLLVGLARTLVSPTPAIDHLSDILRNLSGVGNRPSVCESASVTNPPQIHPDQFRTLMCRDGHWGFSDACGRTVIEPVYDDAAEFSEGLAAVRIGETWFFIDPDGRIAIRCGAYDKIQSFSEGMAAVCHAGNWGYIDRAGSEVITPRFQRAGTMREGLAAVKIDGQYGFIDPDGHWAIQPRFDYATGFRNGAAEVEKDKKTSRIDKIGQILQN